MHPLSLRAALLLPLLGVPLAGCPGDDDDSADDDDDVVDPCAGVEPVAGADVEFVEIGAGLSRPVDIATANDGSGRIFVAEQEGTISVFRPGDDSANRWLDINDRVQNIGGLGDERGLLALAFHPEFATNGKLYVHYSANGGDTTIAEFTVADPAEGEPDPGSERVLLTADQPATNHNGGSIKFGPDGYLYIGLGDGGAGDDAFDNGQNPATLLAKILRIDPDAPGGGREYGIPSDNPFLADPVVDEAYAWGLRNPWRFSFDRSTGALWIADVGQNQTEEIDVGVAGANYGWPNKEGSDCYLGSCQGDFTDPVFEYSHIEGISISGGFVYRGCTLPDLRGLYFFSDFPYSQDSPLWSIDGAGEVGAVWEDDTNVLIATFGEDEQGELLTADYADGRLLRLAPR